MTRTWFMLSGLVYACVMVAVLIWLLPMQAVVGVLAAMVGVLLLVILRQLFPGYWE